MTDTTASVAAHPAKWSAEVMEGVIGPLLRELQTAVTPYRPLRILDPFAGVGLHRINDELAERSAADLIGVELQPEWVQAANTMLPGQTVQGDATDLPAEWSGWFDLIVTSPAFGNRMADQHDAQDACGACDGTGLDAPPDAEFSPGEGPRTCQRCKGQGLSWRNTYAHALRRAGGDLVPGSAAGMQWGSRYRDLHTAAVMEWERVLAPDGMAIVNVKNHLRTLRTGGPQVEQLVSEWWLNTMLVRGWRVQQVTPVPTPGNRYGANHAARVPDDMVLVLAVPTEPGML